MLIAGHDYCPVVPQTDDAIEGLNLAAQHSRFLFGKFRAVIAAASIGKALFKPRMQPKPQALRLVVLRE